MTEMRDTPDLQQPQTAAADRDAAAGVHASFARQGLMRTIGARLAIVREGSATIEVAYSDSIGHQEGHFHAGVIGSIGAMAAGCAARTLMPAGREAQTVDYTINLMRPARGTLLRATGTVVRQGRSVSVARATIEVLDAPLGVTGQVCALLQATILQVDPPA